MLSHYSRVYLTRAGGVHVGMEQRGHKLDLGGSGGEVILEDDLTFVQSSLPGGPLLAGNPVPGENKCHQKICQNKCIELTPTA